MNAKNKPDQFTGRSLRAIFTTAAFGALGAMACWVVALGSVLLCASPAGANDLPFKGRIDGSLVATPTANPAIYLDVAHAVGNANHLGAFTKVTSDVVNLATGEVTGAFTMTAANGDQLTGVYGGSFTFGPAPGTFSWVLNATITGGTGRFLHAIGEFVFIADVNYVVVSGVVNGNYTETFDGIINY